MTGTYDASHGPKRTACNAYGWAVWADGGPSVLTGGCPCNGRERNNVPIWRITRELIGTISAFRRASVHYGFVSPSRIRISLTFSLSLVLVVVLASCSSGADPGGSTAPDASTPTQGASAPTGDQSGTPADERFPDVIGAELAAEVGGTYSIAVTISSPYDSPDQYADGWRVLTPEDVELGSHTLGHDHAGEQPFTRTQYDLAIPSDVSEIIVEGRDTQNGYGGETVTAQVPSPPG